MSAARLLQLLEQSGMLEPSLLAELRKQVADNEHKVSAESIAKVLVDKGHLTKFQATKFVGEATVSAAKEKAAEPEAAATEDTDEDLGLAPDGDEEDLGLAPDGDEEETAQPAAGDDEVVMLEDASGASDEEDMDGLTPVEDAGAALTPVDRPVEELTPVQASSPPEPAPGIDEARDYDPFAGSAAQPAATRLPTRLRKQSGPRWDTMLMYGGGLALALLILLGGMLWYNLTKTPALEMFEAAMEDYRSESYSQAIAKFEDFLKKYPDDENASEARVRVVLGRLRLAVGDPQSGLDAARELIPTIAEEEAFQVAREEFAGILPRIPEGFTKKAKLTDNMGQAEEQLSLAEEGMALVLDPANIPTSIRIRIDTDVQRIQEDMDLVRRSINQDKDLAEAISKITSSVGADDTVGAYEIYMSLLKKYPGLHNNERLIDSIGRITERERKLVKVAQEPLAATTDDPPSVADYQVALASRKGEGSNRVKGRVAAVLAAGSVYGLDAGTGEVLWRRHVGYGTTFHPVRVSEQPDADVVLADAKRQELVRCRAVDGAVVWRLPVGEPFADPVVAGPHTYVATHSGRLLDVDTQTGNSASRVVIPQKLPVGPAISPSHRRALQIGEHSNLYMVSTDSLECTGVIYLGHKRGAVSLSPLVLLGHVFVIDNAGSDYALLRILSLKSEAEGPMLRRAQTPIRLDGNVRVPLVAYGRRLLLLTDRGAIRVFDVDINDPDQPVKEAASLTSRYDHPVMGYPLTDASSLWVADNRLTHYRVQVTTKEINRSADIANVGDTFVAPLQLFQDVLVSVRRVKNSAGVTVAGVQIDKLRRPIWQTHLGVPVSHVAVDAERQELVAVTAAATTFKVDRATLERGRADQPDGRAPPSNAPLSFTDALPLGDGRVAVLNPADAKHVLLFEPTAAAGNLRLVELQLGDSAKPSGSPISYQGGLLIPSENGEVLLLNPNSGENQVLPFQPKLEPGETIQWQRPDVCGENGSEFVIVDDRRFVYRVGIKPLPQPFLAELAKARLDVQIVSGLAVAGETAFGVVAADSGGHVVVALGLGDLKIAQEWDLEGGRVTWGPRRVGNAVLVVIDDKQLRCFDAGPKERWQEPAAVPGQPVGLPLQSGEDFLFASANGTVWRVAGATGKVSGTADVGEPLGAGPVAFGSRMLLCGNDGALLVVPMPAGS